MNRERPPQTREEWQQFVRQAWAAADRTQAPVQADQVQVRQVQAHQVQVHQVDPPANRNPGHAQQANGLPTPPRTPPPERAPPRLRTPPRDGGRDR